MAHYVHRCNEVQGGQQQVPYLQPSVRPPQMPRSANREIPYLSHLRTHHGQVTLVPPESPARVRKPSAGRSGRNPCVYDPPSPRGRRGTTQVPRPSVHAQLDGELCAFHWDAQSGPLTSLAFCCSRHAHPRLPSPVVPGGNHVACLQHARDRDVGCLVFVVPFHPKVAICRLVSDHLSVISHLTIRRRVRCGCHRCNPPPSKVLHLRHE